MSLLQPKKIEELIVANLKKRPVVTTKLVVDIASQRRHTTKQAVYAALRQMKAREEIVSYRGTSALNVTWLNRLAGFVAAAKGAYVGLEASEDELAALSPGDSITYYFRNPLKADVFWTHAYYLFMEQAPPGEPVYLYNPHEWFLLARKQNELEVIRTTIASGRKFLVLCGSRTPLDKYVRHSFDGEKSQYHMLERPRFPANYYLNVFGEILLEVWLDRKTTANLEAFYRSTVEWNQAAEARLTAIVNQGRRLRIRVSHNGMKAEVFKRLCHKFFFIPPPKS